MQLERLRAGTYEGHDVDVDALNAAFLAAMQDQPWDVALRAILQAQGLAAKEDQDGIIAVDSYENIAKQQASEPLTTQIISVNYARASTLVSTVKSLLSKECAPGTAGGIVRP